MTHKYIQKRCMARNLEAHHKTEEMDVRITSHYKSLDWTHKYIEKRFMARNLEAHHKIEMDICTY
jgi:hypothetical protein